MSDRPELTLADLESEHAVALPAKEVVSLLNLNVDLDVALDLAAPIDLAVAANANIAAPIDAAVSANVLAIDSSATSLGQQATQIDQFLSGEAIAEAPQSALVDQSGDLGGTDGGTTEGGGSTGTTDGSAGTAATDGGTTDGLTDGVTDTVDQVTGSVGDAISGLQAGSLLEGGLLNVDVNAAVDADLAAPVAGAVAANANAAAPISASVAANIGTVGSEAVAVSDQTAIISQQLDGVTAHALADQDAEVIQ